MFEIEFDLTPSTEQLTQWVEAIEQKAINDLRPFWNIDAKPVVVEEIARVFASEGYGLWPPLSPKYARYKSRHYPGRKILQRTQAYFRAATGRSGANSGGNIFVATKDEMTWGIDLNWFAGKAGFPYPVVHEHGSTRRNIPRRAVFATAAESRILEEKLIRALGKYLVRQIRQETSKLMGQGGVHRV